MEFLGSIAHISHGTILFWDDSTLAIVTMEMPNNSDALSFNYPLTCHLCSFNPPKNWNSITGLSLLHKVVQWLNPCFYFGAVNEAVLCQARCFLTWDEGEMPTWRPSWAVKCPFRVSSTQLAWPTGRKQRGRNTDTHTSGLSRGQSFHLYHLPLPHFWSTLILTVITNYTLDLTVLQTN